MRKLKPTFGNGFAGGTAAALDFGTSPHGLSADLAPAVSGNTPKEQPATLPAKPVLTFQQAPEGRAAAKPMVYTSAKARSACRCLREASAKPPYYLRLDDQQFLQVYLAIEQDRSRTRKAIGKGIAELHDLRASDPLWQILQDVMTRRMKGYRL